MESTWGTPSPVDDVPKQLAAVLDSELPLAGGLRAIADEQTSASAARQLRSLAQAIEAGQPIVRALEQLDELPYLKGLLAAAGHSGCRVDILMKLVEHQRQIASERRSLSRTLMYPLVVATLGIVVAFALPMLIAPTCRDMFFEFQLKQSRSTTWMIMIGTRGSPVVLGSLATLIACLGLARFRLPQRWWSAVMSSVPLLGRVWYWSGIAEFQRWLSLMIAARMPLPDALRIAANQVENIELQRSSLKLARYVEAGESLTHAVHRTHAWPSSTIPLLYWGERSGELADALNASAEMLEGRARSRAYWVRDTIPSVILVLTGVMVVSTFSAVMIPVFQLIKMLSG